jgi:hypothetical protein
VSSESVAATLDAVHADMTQQYRHARRNQKKLAG